MLFYNYQNIKDIAKYNPTRILQTLVKYKDKKILNLDVLNKIKGSSYLLNISDLVNDKTVDILHKMQYLELAAKRNYSDYKYNRFSGLDLSMFPDIDIAKLKYNKLLTVTNNTLNFKYEQVKNGN